MGERSERVGPGAETLASGGLTVVLPAYNEEANIEGSVQDVLAAFEHVTRDLEIIIVDDGSSDRTGEISDALAKKDARVRVIHHQGNRGYGAALRSGFAAATKGFVFYTDSDRQFDLSEFDRLLPLIPGADVVTGYRANRRDPIHRRINAGIYNQMLSTLFGLHVRDVDCAFKVWRSETLRSLDLESDSIFISAEALIKAARRGCVIREVPVTHFPRAHGTQTGNSPGTLARALREFIRLTPAVRRRRDARGSGGPDQA